jgi:hypothetical protein
MSTTLLVHLGKMYNDDQMETRQSRYQILTKLIPLLVRISATDSGQTYTLMYIDFKNAASHFFSR